MINKETTKRLLNLQDIIALKSKYLAEPYSLHLPVKRNSNCLKAEIVKWNGDKPNVLGCMHFSKLTDDLWEVDEVYLLAPEYSGIGKLLYYLAMNAIYPAFLTPSGEGVSQAAKRIYDTFELLSYVECQDIFPRWKGTDVLLDDYTVIR